MLGPRSSPPSSVLSVLSFFLEVESQVLAFEMCHNTLSLLPPEGQWIPRPLPRVNVDYGGAGTDDDDEVSHQVF